MSPIGSGHDPAVPTEPVVSTSTAPPQEPPSALERRAAGLGGLVLRLVVGFAFLHEAAWKRPPDFGRANESGLWEWSNFAVDYPVFVPYSWLVENVVQPNFILFGWSVFFLEAAIGGLLIVGLFTRAIATAGTMMSLAITFSVLNQPVIPEWEIAYYLLIAANVALVGIAAGRSYGLDGVLRPLWRRSGGPVAKTLLRVT